MAWAMKQRFGQFNPRLAEAWQRQTLFIWSTDELIKRLSGGTHSDASTELHHDPDAAILEASF